MHDLAVALSERLVTSLPPERRQPELREIVAFGLEIGLGTLWELAVILAVAAWLGFLPEVALAVLAAGSFRLCAGGGHCTAYYRCLLSSIVTFNFLAWLAAFLAARSGTVFALGAWLSTAAVCFYAVYRWAPADTPRAPISASSRPRLRRLSFFCLAFWLALTLKFYFTGSGGSLFWAAILALLLQGYTISPSGYRFIAGLDKLLKFLLPLEKINGRRQKNVEEAHALHHDPGRHPGRGGR
ncbi:MAG: hypothetical protein PWP65_1918 [Clostridia bacterium]|nr:hypothetical protein [Clostridia bacterium]